MGGFFDPNPRLEEVFPMYGTGHLIALLVMLAFIPLMVWQKERVAALRRSRRFMVAFSLICLAVEIQEYAFMWVYGYQPFYERLPFHLCGGLALVLPILVLLERYDIIKFLAGWSVAAGLISLLNLGITHNGPQNLTFYHYFFRHYYLFLFPIFLFIAGEYEITYRDYLKSMAGLIAWSGVIFLADWITGANYMYIGQNSDMEVPFMRNYFGSTCIENRVVRHGPLLVAGLGGARRYNKGDHQFTECHMRRRIWRLIPRLLWNKLVHGRYLDILLAHAAPFGLNDRPDPTHRGFQVFISFMDRFKPRYLLHGHIHLYDLNAERTVRYRETEIINVYDHFTLEFDPEER